MVKMSKFIHFTHFMLLSANFQRLQSLKCIGLELFKIPLIFNHIKVFEDASTEGNILS